MVNLYLNPLRCVFTKACGFGLLLLMLFSPPLLADYAVQVGAYHSAPSAERYAAKVRESGFPVRMEQVNRSAGGSLILILVGPYPSLREAKAVLTQLQARDIEGFVLPAPSPPQERPSLRHSMAEKKTGKAVVPPDATKLQKPVSMPKLEVMGAKPAQEEAPTPAAPVEEIQVLAQDQDGVAEDFLIATASDEAPPLSGFFQSELAYTLPEPDHFSVFLNTLELRGGGGWGSSVQWRLGVRASYDAVFDINDFYPPQVEDDQRFQANVWETYLDYSAGAWDLRLGRQHIIWGEMVGLFFADVVSAKDMRQFVLPEFDMIRIPQWAARVEHFQGDVHSELIWIPYPTYDEIGVPGAEFYPGPLPPPPGYAPVFQDERRPAGGLDQSGYGMRVSALKAGWDMAGFYYSAMDGQPAFLRQVTTVGGGPAFVYTPDHQRIEQMGGTLSKDLSSVVLKAELVYTHGRLIEVARLSDPDGVVRQDHVDYAVGIDYAGLEQSRLNFQLFQRWFPDHDTDMVSDRVESGVTLFTSTTMASGELEPQLLVMAGLNRGDWLARPRLVWHAGAHWRVAAGADVFGGSRLGLFGRFDDQDRVYTELRYTF